MRAAIFIPVLLVGGLVGCASTGVRPSLVNQEEAAYAYPLEEVWPVVQAWYRERGFQYREDAARFVLQAPLYRRRQAGGALAQQGVGHPRQPQPRAGPHP